MRVGDLVKLNTSGVLSGDIFIGIIVAQRSDPEGYIYEVLWADSKNLSFVRKKAISRLGENYV